MRYEVGNIIKSLNYTKNGFDIGDIYEIRTLSDGYYHGKLLAVNNSHKDDKGRNYWSLEDITIKDNDFEVLI